MPVGVLGSRATALAASAQAGRAQAPLPSGWHGPPGAPELPEALSRLNPPVPMGK